MRSLQRSASCTRCLHSVKAKYNWISLYFNLKFSFFKNSRCFLSIYDIAIGETFAVTSAEKRKGDII